MRTLNLVNDDRQFSSISIQEEINNEKYPKNLVFNNSTVLNITLPSSGILQIKSKIKSNDTLVFSGGIHGDEKAGIEILDHLVEEIVSGTLEVKHNLLLIYGNLRAMNMRDGKGHRCIEPELGIISNLNRCFNQGIFGNPKSYAQIRANEITSAVEKFVRGFVEVIDIHQSFVVPTVRDVRGNNNRTEYTYAILYYKDVKKILNWIYEKYSDIVAGAVLNDMSQKHTSFAGYMAQKFEANSATFEQGAIGYTDWDTFTPQLLQNIKTKISGNGKLKKPLGFDVWKFTGNIIKETEDFKFLSKDGEILKKNPIDFLPIGYSRIAKDNKKYFDIADNERLLFSNCDVPLRDRVAMIIKKIKTDIVPPPPIY